jgi:hypothetical protein
MRSGSTRLQNFGVDHQAFIEKTSISKGLSRISPFRPLREEKNRHSIPFLLQSQDMLLVKTNLALT